jgi:cold shock CspA family protein
VWFDKKRGIGFLVEIKDGDGDGDGEEEEEEEEPEEVFCHQSAIVDGTGGFRKLLKGEEVWFEVKEGRNGKPAATNVQRTARILRNKTRTSTTKTKKQKQANW